MSVDNAASLNTAMRTAFDDAEDRLYRAEDEEEDGAGEDPLEVQRAIEKNAAHVAAERVVDDYRKQVAMDVSALLFLSYGAIRKVAYWWPRLATTFTGMEMPSEGLVLSVLLYGSLSDMLGGIDATLPGLSGGSRKVGRFTLGNLTTIGLSALAVYAGSQVTAGIVEKIGKSREQRMDITVTYSEHLLELGHWMRMGGYLLGINIVSTRWLPTWWKYAKNALGIPRSSWGKNFARMVRGKVLGAVGLTPAAAGGAGGLIALLAAWYMGIGNRVTGAVSEQQQVDAWTAGVTSVHNRFGAHLMHGAVVAAFSQWLGAKMRLRGGNLAANVGNAVANGATLITAGVGISTLCYLAGANNAFGSRGSLNPYISTFLQDGVVAMAGHGWTREAVAAAGESPVFQAVLTAGAPALTGITQGAIDHVLYKLNFSRSVRRRCLFAAGLGVQAMAIGGLAVAPAAGETPFSTNAQWAKRVHAAAASAIMLSQLLATSNLAVDALETTGVLERETAQQDLTDRNRMLLGRLSGIMRLGNLGREKLAAMIALVGVVGYVAKDLYSFDPSVNPLQTPQSFPAVPGGHDEPARAVEDVRALPNRRKPGRGRGRVRCRWFGSVRAAAGGGRGLVPRHWP